MPQKIEGLGSDAALMTMEWNRRGKAPS